MQTHSYVWRSKKELEQNLEQIVAWCKLNCTEISVGRCGFIKVSNNWFEENHEADIYYNDAAVFKAKNFKFLGINLNDKLLYIEIA